MRKLVLDLTIPTSRFISRRQNAQKHTNLSSPRGNYQLYKRHPNAYCDLNIHQWETYRKAISEQTQAPVETTQVKGVTSQREQAF